MVDRNHLGGPTDIAIRTQSHFEANIEPWKKYADTAQAHGTPTIVQICHAGRQSPIGAGQRGMMAKTLAPSAIPLSIGDGWIAQGARSFMFGTPKEMTVEEIEDVVERFVVAARCVHSAGFKGVEVHGAHGYLLCKFSSCLWTGDVPARMKMTD